MTERSRMVNAGDDMRDAIGYDPRRHALPYRLEVRTPVDAPRPESAPPQPDSWPPDAAQIDAGLATMLDDPATADDVLHATISNDSGSRRAYVWATRTEGHPDSFNCGCGQRIDAVHMLSLKTTPMLMVPEATMPQDADNAAEGTETDVTRVRPALHAVWIQIHSEANADPGALAATRFDKGKGELKPDANVDLLQLTEYLWAEGAETEAAGVPTPQRFDMAISARTGPPSDSDLHDAATARLPALPPPGHGVELIRILTGRSPGDDPGVGRWHGLLTTATGLRRARVAAHLATQLANIAPAAFDSREALDRAGRSGGHS